ncbi:hypothetical protein RRG08_018375 [Elysia crispata]|uniref:Uncharacterized protein n=1 Tax=Elysia crispata TaxID=231223 RepID=A0AAE0YLN0_9GAST|nr:hypothetical protein RRG08_018375 [Elysia crispata]
MATQFRECFLQVPIALYITIDFTLRMLLYIKTRFMTLTPRLHCPFEFSYSFVARVGCHLPVIACDRASRPDWRGHDFQASTGPLWSSGRYLTPTSEGPVGLDSPVHNSRDELLLTSVGLDSPVHNSRDELLLTSVGLDSPVHNSRDELLLTSVGLDSPVHNSRDELLLTSVGLDSPVHNSRDELLLTSVGLDSPVHNSRDELLLTSVGLDSPVHNSRDELLLTSVGLDSPVHNSRDELLLTSVGLDSPVHNSRDELLLTSVGLDSPVHNSRDELLLTLFAETVRARFSEAPVICNQFSGGDRKQFCKTKLYDEPIHKMLEKPERWKMVRIVNRVIVSYLDKPARLIGRDGIAR